MVQTDNTAGTTTTLAFRTWALRSSFVEVSSTAVPVQGCSVSTLLPEVRAATVGSARCSVCSICIMWNYYEDNSSKIMQTTCKLYNKTIQKFSSKIEQICIVFSYKRKIRVIIYNNTKFRTLLMYNLFTMW